MSKLLLTMLTLIGCGGTQPEYANVEFQQEIGDYQNVFDRDVDYVDIHMVDVLTGEPSPFAVADCDMGNAYIRVQKAFWDKATALTRQQLIFHELGHCDMAEFHRTSYRPDGCNTSIMGAALTSDRCYLKYYSEYTSEIALFDQNLD